MSDGGRRVPADFGTCTGSAQEAFFCHLLLYVFEIGLFTLVELQTFSRDTNLLQRKAATPHSED